MNDNFTEAARAEGQARIAAMLEAAGASDDIRAWFPAGFEKGAEWARTHLAAQEPTDAECIAVLNAVTTPFGEKPGRAEWAPAAIRRCREAMVSARAARRDEMNR